MKIGSIVRLSRPYLTNISYTDALGIIIKIYNSPVTDESMCIVRFINELDLITHIEIEIYTHRLDVIKG